MKHNYRENYFDEKLALIPKYLNTDKQGNKNAGIQKMKQIYIPSEEREFFDETRMV